MTAASDAALVIGIAHYPWLNPLDGSVRDARRVADWLVTRGGLPGTNLELVLSDGAAQGHPILQEIDDAFDRIFAQARSRGTARRLYVYFAGHGCSREIEHVALLMANADLQRLNRAINVSEYRDALAQRLFPEQIYLFDCCRNYDRSVTGRGPEWTFDEAIAPMQDSIQVVLYAAGFTEYANERNLIYNHKRGLFTEALIEGLNGAAASGDLSGGDGIVSTARLIPYLRDRLDQLTRAENVRQHFWHEIRGARDSVVLATGVTPWRRSVTVDMPPGTRKLVVRDRNYAPVLVKEIAASVRSIEVQLELTEYTLTAEPDGASATIRLLADEPTAVSL
jgi:Caspase domain